MPKFLVESIGDYDDGDCINHLDLYRYARRPGCSLQHVITR